MLATPIANGSSSSKQQQNGDLPNVKPLNVNGNHAAASGEDKPIANGNHEKTTSTPVEEKKDEVTAAVAEVVSQPTEQTTTETANGKHTPPSEDTQQPLTA